MFQKRRFFYIAVILLIGACKNPFQKSSPSSSDKDPPLGVAIFKTAKDLPKCDKDLEKSLIYIQDEKKFQTCSGEKWRDLKVEAKGDQGESGDRGPSGVVSTNIAGIAQSVFSKNVKSIAYIEVKYEGTGCSQYEAGSGFIVANNVVATNGHVLKASTSGTCGTMDLKDARVWYPQDAKGDTKKNEVAASALGLKADRSIASTDDIALLQVDTLGRTPLTLSAFDEAPDHLTGDGIKLADDLLHIGYSGATSFAHLTIGRINGIQTTSSIFLSSLVSQGIISMGKTVYEYDLVSGGGASGGPLFSLNGEVIGINFAGNTSESDTEFGFGVQVKPLRELLPKSRNWQDL